MDMKRVLTKLVARQHLTTEEAQCAMRLIADGEADVAQTAAFLALLSAKGETPQEIASLVLVMRSKLIPVQIIDSCDVVDVVGTGGDGHDTLNFSTGAAILAAACGLRVCKHGNRSASSACGTADVLEVLGGMLLDGTPALLPSDPARIAETVNTCGISFMFAPHFHPAMKHVVPVRKALKIPTVFNIMGPLLNPASAGCLMLGVYDPELLLPYAKVLNLLGGNLKKALIVHSCGLDELSPLGVARCVEISPAGGIVEGTIDPNSFGVPTCTLADLKGTQSAEGNAARLKEILGGGDAADSHAGRTIALNAGGALYVAGRCKSIAEGYAHALGVLRGGGASAKLEEWISTARVSAKRARTE